MAIKASAQETIVDITDAYSVYLTCASYTFPGTTTSAKAGSCNTTVVAMRGVESVPAVVNSASVIAPSGVNVSATNNSDGTCDLEISVTTAVKTPGKVTIPATVNGEAEFTLEFSFGIALTGQTGAAGIGVESIVEQYYQSTSFTEPTGGTWISSHPTWVDGKYLWTRSVITYTDNSSKQTEPICVTGGKGDTGGSGADGNGIVSVDVHYYLSNSSSALEGGTWSTTAPSWVNGKFMWSKTVTTYTNGMKDESNPVCITGQKGETGETGKPGEPGQPGEPGEPGQPGADALVMVITSSNGTIFKNSRVETTLTANVYKGGIALTASEIAALGTVKWYKDGAETPAATGLTFNISASTVNVRTNIVAQLEG